MEEIEQISNDELLDVYTMLKQHLDELNQEKEKPKGEEK